MTRSEREEIEKPISAAIEVCIKMREKGVGPQDIEAEEIVLEAIITQVAKARKEQIEKDTRNFKRLVKIFLGEEAEIEFSEKMAKGWNNLMKFLSEDSATN